MNAYTKLIVFSIALLSAQISAAQIIRQDPCKQVVVVGDTNWEPYALHQQEGITGVGVDLASQIFQELDIPVKIIDFKDRRRIMHALRLGDADVIVSVYNNEDISDILEIIEPGFHSDPIAIAIRRGKPGVFQQWDDLIGQRGVITTNFAFEESFAEYSQRYLYLHQKGSLNQVLSILNDRKADFLVGSRLQLDYGIKRQELNQDIEVIDSVQRQSNVHMGFSKNSACYTYLPYLKKRLVELKADGSVLTLVNKYMASLVEKPEDEFERLFKFDD